MISPTENSIEDLKKEKIFVFGHQNPDTDSICSAIAYANLKRELGFENTQAYRLGHINNETKFVLEHFGFDSPTPLGDVKIRVRDLPLYTPIMLSENDPIKKAWDYLSKHKGSRLLPVLSDADETIAGIITLGDITRIFMETLEDSESEKHETLFENLLTIFETEVVYGSYNYEKVEGELYIGSTAIKPDAKISDRDIVITGKKETAYKYAFEYNCGCIFFVADGADIDISEFKDSKPALCVVNKSIYNTIVLAKQAISVGSVMKRDEIFKFAEDNYIEDVFDFMKTSTHRNFPVVDKFDKFVGTVSRRHFMGFQSKKVILVDHNERTQSVEGLESATILEVIDHHRIADIKTDAPLYVRAEPVGSSATIVYKMYKENDIPINRRIAGLLISAILSDTLMLRSPTCTWEDVNACEKLAPVAEIDVTVYGREMFTAGTSLEGFTDERILSSDLKMFTFGKYSASISQINTLDFTNIKNRMSGLLDAMKNFKVENHLDLSILMITDIVIGGSNILVVGDDMGRKFVADTFGVKEEDDGSFYLSGVVSRKKQMVPQLTISAQRI